MSTEEPQPVAAPEPQPEAEAAPEGQPDPEPQPRRRGFRTGRLEAFSDGVFAIAVTLLILDIGVSGTAGRDLGGAIRALWPSYLA
jgi:transmembrane protein TMEM174 (potassium channel)